MKTFILTIDYELFLGRRTGTVEKCMIEPTELLAGLLELNNSKMTVFWDILHYYRLTELEGKFQELKNDRKLIEDQISFLILKGHDIQLHLHPHWLDAVYKNGQWEFKYVNFKLHSLSEEENPDKIDTILGCITISKQLMEEVVRKYRNDYNVTAFRAGGYLIEPFAKINNALQSNKIYVDSSVLPGMSNDNPVNCYNFKGYPFISHYNFSSSPIEQYNNGLFTEIPITTIRIPAFRNFIFALIRRLKYPRLESGRMGTGFGETAIKNNYVIKKSITSLIKPKLVPFTTDGNFKERFNYMYRKIKNNSTMILHPKLLNQHTLKILEYKLKNNEVKFITISNFLNSIE